MQCKKFSKTRVNLNGSSLRNQYTEVIREPRTYEFKQGAACTGCRPSKKLDHELAYTLTALVCAAA